MDTKELSREQISAFADGELSEAQTEVVLAALRTEQGLAAWNDYHLIGDAARSDETAVAMSPDFFSKLSARLDAEPTIIAPVLAERQQAARQSVYSRLVGQRFAVPALALALVAAIVIILQPQSPTIVASAPAAANTEVAVATPAPAQKTVVPGSGLAPATDTPAVATLVHDGDVLRDPKIDRFLGDHETFTPQQSSEQLSRSAAFNVNADK